MKRIRLVVLGIGLLLSIAFWLADAVIDSLMFGEGTFTEHAFVNVSAYEIYIRLLVLAILMVSAHAVSAVLVKRRRAEDALGASERKYRSLFENMLTGFAYHRIVLDEEGKPVDYVFLDVNNAFQEFTGMERDHVIGRSVREVLPGIEDDPADWIGTYGRVALGGESLIFEHYSENLKQWYSVAVYSPHEGHFVTLFQNTTERKESEKALKESEEKFSKAFHSSPNLMAITTRNEGRYIDVNNVFATIIGYSREELIGHTSIERGLWMESADRERMVQQIQYQGSVSGLELIVRTKSGASMTVLFGAELVTISGEECLITMATDITGRKRIEEQARQSQVLASLGEMTAGIAHEVNNPLAAILLYSELITQSELTSAARRDLKVIRSEAKRASTIMKNLLTYSRKAEPITRRMDLRKTLTKVIGMRRYQERVRNIDVAAEMADQPIRVLGNAPQLTQVFMNLIVNAEEAVEQSNDRRIVVSTETDAGMVIISIADSGVGIPEENLKQLFVPFFTTKPIGKGTGLGLAACHGIVTAHGGSIRAENNDMGGATFVVALPLAK